MRVYMKRAVAIAVVICATTLTANTGAGGDPYANIPAGKRESLKTRLSEYVDNSRTRNWGKLYDLVSDTGRGGINRDGFIDRMKQAHGVSFANYPDLLQFVPARADKSEDGGFDLYGCAEARREGEEYKGIAVVHAVYERESWFFTGWSFDGMASGSCSALKKADWQPFTRLRWNHIMEELR
jgi:hypothetical protein